MDLVRRLGRPSVTQAKKRRPGESWARNLELTHLSPFPRGTSRLSRQGSSLHVPCSPPSTRN